MPLPLILGAAAAVAGAAGIGSGIHGAKKMKDANDTMKSANSRHNQNIARFDKQNKVTTADMDSLGTLELEILKSFEDFSNVFEKIQNRPKFKEYQIDETTIPKYDAETFKKVFVGAGVLLGGLGGAAAGAAAGFAASGATTAAVMALGTASTGTAIASLSGAAAVNATLAALGGGAIAAGGGGIALGTTVLGAASAGVAFLIGGIVFNITGSSLSKKADEAWIQMQKAEKEINQICSYLEELDQVSIRYRTTLEAVNTIYKKHLSWLQGLVEITNKTNWDDFTSQERTATENTVLLVGLLYNMCKVKLVLQSESENTLNTINHEEINKSVANAKTFLQERNLASE